MKITSLTTTVLLALSLAMGLALSTTATAAAQAPTKVSKAKLAASGVSKLRMKKDWKHFIVFAGEEIRPQKGYKMLRKGNVITITNDTTSRVSTYAASHVGAVQNRAGTCVVQVQICACPTTLSANIYGGAEEDGCQFSGSASESTCGGDTCCAYFDQDQTVECPPE